MKDQNIQTKIQKVIALMQGAQTEGELQAATCMLQKLLAKYNLTMEEVAGTTDQEVKDFQVLQTEKWQSYLARAIALNMRCENYTEIRWDSDKGKYVKKTVFVGLPEDVKVVIMSYDICQRSARKLYRSWAQEYRKANYLGTISTKLRKSWYLGFVHGIDSALEEQKNSTQELALALQTPTLVEEHMESLNLRKSKSRGCRVNDTAYNAGFESGKSSMQRDRLAA